MITTIMTMLFLASIIVFAHASTSDWPTFHYNEARTGSTTSLAPNSPVLLWQKELPDAIVSSPAIFNGKIYVGCDDMKVYALDANTGDQQWNFTTNAAVRGSPTVARLSEESFDRIFVHTDAQRLYCLNASSGESLWITTLTNVGTWKCRSSPLVEGSYLYISYKIRMGNVINKLNVLTGKAIVYRSWDIENNLVHYSSPAIYAGRLISGHDTKVRCHDAGDMTEKWVFSTGDHVYSTPAYYNGKVYFGSADNKTYAVNVLLGTEIWNYTTGSIFGSPAVVDDVVFAASDGAPYCVYALDSNTGALIWYYNMTYPVKSSPAVADGKVFVGTLDGKLVALNSSTGQEVWSYSTGTLGEIWSSPAIANGVIYFGSNDHKLYAIKDSIVVSDPSRDPEGDVDPGTDIDVFVNVTASQGIGDVIILYTTNRTASLENITMTIHNAETGTYNGMIPGQQPNTLITYKIIAYDRFGDFVVKDGGSLWCTIPVIPEFSPAIVVQLLMVLSLITAVLAKRTTKN